jgi:hypothetical protein
VAGFTVFYDASVLYPADLRNLLMHLALSGLFQAKWSAAVHAEWISALLRRRPDLSRQKLERTRMLMDLHAPDALVTNFEHLIDGLHLPDPDDRHVLAAAIHCGADVIVTANLKDFPLDRLAEFGIQAMHPDDFVLGLLDLAPVLVVTAARDHRESLKHPAKTAVEYLNSLRSQGLVRTAESLQAYLI